MGLKYYYKYIQHLTPSADEGMIIMTYGFTKCNGFCWVWKIKGDVALVLNKTKKKRRKRKTIQLESSDFTRGAST